MIDRSFEELSVKRAVFRQGIPAIISQMIVLLYNWADAFFVGKLNDPEQLAAVTVVTPLFLIVTAIANLPGVGGCALLSSYLGARKYESARQVSSVSFWTALVMALLYSALFICFGKTLLCLTGASGNVMGYALDYSKYVIVIGCIPIILTQVLANMVRAMGMSAQASAGVSLGAILNILIDPLLILPQGAGLGVMGAGIATAFSNVVALGYFLVIIKSKRCDGMLSLRLFHLRRFRDHFSGIMKRGLPSSAQYMLTVVAVAALAHFVSGYGSEATAALAIVKELDYLPLYFSIGLSQGMLPLISFCYGSGNVARRKAICKFGTLVSVGFALVCFVCYECFSPTLARIFINDPLTDKYIADFLRCMVVAMPFMAFCYPIITNFQATGHVREAMICTLLRKGVLDIPLLFIYNTVWPLYGCMWVQPTVDFISMLTALYFIRKLTVQNSPILT